VPVILSVLDAPLPADTIQEQPPVPCTVVNSIDAPSPEVAAILDPDLYRGHGVSDMVLVTGSDPRNAAYLHPLAAGPFIRMRNAAMAEGIEVAISSGWRSWNRQMKAYRIFRQTGRNLSGDRVPNVAHAAESRHPAGVAIDLRIEDGSPLLPWLETNAACFGFVNTREDEPWEYQFTGIGRGAVESPADIPAR
jgi:LAS superfamily LD-carboxypeptidase LdcB